MGLLEQGCTKRFVGSRRRDVVKPMLQVGEEEAQSKAEAGGEKGLNDRLPLGKRELFAEQDEVDTLPEAGPSFERKVDGFDEVKNVVKELVGKRWNRKVEALMRNGYGARDEIGPWQNKIERSAEELAMRLDPGVKIVVEHARVMTDCGNRLVR